MNGKGGGATGESVIGTNQLYHRLGDIITNGICTPIGKVSLLGILYLERHINGTSAFTFSVCVSAAERHGCVTNIGHFL